MKCDKCGAAISQGQKFCNQCGARITGNSNRRTSDDFRQYERTTQNSNTKQGKCYSEEIDTFDLEDFKNYCAYNEEADGKEEYSNPSRQVHPRRTQANPQKSADTPQKKDKSKTVAGLLALFLGSFGAQWFYLGKPVRAVIYLVVSVAFPWAAFISIMEGLFFLFSKRPSFDKYVNATGFDSITVMLKPLGWTAAVLCFVLVISAFASGEDEGQLQEPQQKSMAVEETVANSVQQDEPRETAQPRTTEESLATAENIPENNEQEYTAVPDLPPDSKVKTILLPLQFQYAEKIGAELISFYSQEESLCNWILSSHYDPVYLETEVHLFGPTQYKQTINPSKYIYLGDLKNNRPDGYGILCSESEISSGSFDINGCYYNLMYMGSFKSGQYSGFGIEYDNTYEENTEYEYGYLYACPFEYGTEEYNNYYERWINCVEFEGMFQEGERAGVGNTFSRPMVESLEYIQNEEKIMFSYIGSGEYSSDELNGYAKIYAGKYLLYDGNWKNGEFDGYGKLYYLNSTTLEYEGNFKRGQRNGKGTSYHQDGSVEYSGQWKNDDVA